MTKKFSVSITGMGIISAAGMGITPLWNACLNKSAVTENGLGKISDSSLLQIQNQLNLKDISGKSLLMSLYAITEATQEAKWNDFTADDVIVIGTTTGQIGIWENDLLSYSASIAPGENGVQALSKQPLASLSNDLKKHLKFPGRIIILSSACSASTQAFILGEQLINSGRANRVIAGGVEELGQLTINGFGCLKLLNSSPCKPFDQNRAGINLSEGSAFYTLEKSSTKKSYGTLLGGDTFLDSYHMTSPNPEGLGLEKAILSALKQAEVKPSEIGFVHAHGTGSGHNDSSESFALHNLLPHGPEVVSTKGVHGHALGASGAIELGICLKIFSEKTLPPVTGLELVDESIKLNLPQTKKSKDVSYILKTTLGFGGINSALILKAPHA